MYQFLVKLEYRLRGQFYRRDMLWSRLAMVYWPLLLITSLTVLSGCQVITNPAANGIPVRLVSDDLLAGSKNVTKPIPLEWLRQPIPEVYRLDSGDILGVYIDGIIGGKEDLPPVTARGGDEPPAIGLPIAIREDGTVPLPLIDPVNAEGLTVAELEKRIIDAYTNVEGILRPEKTRILVSLLQRRTIKIHVIRQDSASNGKELDLLQNPLQRSGPSYPSRQYDSRGTAVVLELPAFENDLMNALTRTGGLPGLDALNVVEIRRGRRKESVEGTPKKQSITRVPLRIRPGQSRPFTDEDILLHSGDIVFIGRRDSDFFFTGGLLGNRKVQLPRDSDIRVVEAIVESGGPIVNGSFTSNNLSGAISSSGLGTPNPSLLSVIRRVPDGRQINIKVDLNRAIMDPRENIIVQKNDLLILQETPDEAFARYLSTILQFNLFGRFIDRQDASATGSVVLP